MATCEVTVLYGLGVRVVHGMRARPRRICFVSHRSAQTFGLSGTVFAAALPCSDDVSFSWRIAADGGQNVKWSNNVGKDYNKGHVFSPRGSPNLWRPWKMGSNDIVVLFKQWYYVQIRPMKCLFVSETPKEGACELSFSY